jgi:hypothetical protein
MLAFVETGGSVHYENMNCSSAVMDSWRQAYQQLRHPRRTNPMATVDAVSWHISIS